MGAGEPSTIPIAAAIANAIFDATRARVREGMDPRQAHLFDESIDELVLQGDEESLDAALGLR